ncbi:putative flavo protein [Aspergillus ellipticus CBS 707.79]|uniref:Putative flavo protein n=1 Tax=Aspergillus ellipticus CBS 707.79 TaxID=1448320 RepID=A0A319CST8_9EURO|nr:putative flavo protein [Aspergillus ellipticus CBS 707.79]
MKRDIKDFAFPQRSTEGIYADNLETDVLIVGAGFSGIYCLHELRKLGLKTVIYEASTEIGGTWRWNCYPGARVDSKVPLYQLSIPETYKDWTWTTNYPDFHELRAYFEHVDKVLEVRKDVAFGSTVIDAQFDQTQHRWTIKTKDGRTAHAKYFIVAAGVSAKPYIPDYPGIDQFKGEIHHTSFWPQEDIDIRGKRCAVIGTGASGIQVVQAWGPTASSLKVFQRTPNYAIPMRKRDLTAEEQNGMKPLYPQLFEMREKTFTGFLCEFTERLTCEDNDAEREAFYESRWEAGGFDFSTANYKDALLLPDSNRLLYNFWAKKVRARVTDPATKDLVAPLEPPYFFGAKRSSLEINYYEQFNRPTVDLIDIAANPIVGFTETGIRLADGTTHEVDVVCLATGFDTTTGSMTNMGLRSITGINLADDWKAGAQTYLGLTVEGYPNMFHLFGTHGPTLFSNAPTTIEIQGRWIRDAIKHMERQGIRSINPTAGACRTWKKQITAFSKASLFPTTSSTYMGGGIPGKAYELVSYPGGQPLYARQIHDALPAFAGFEVLKGDGSTVTNPEPHTIDATTDFLLRLFGMPPLE